MEMKIKTWIIDKAQIEAKRYNTWFDFSRRTDGIAREPLVEDDCYYMNVTEIIKETEKAVQIKLSSGECDGSFNGWTLWVPKSQIMENNI